MAEFTHPDARLGPQSHPPVGQQYAPVPGADLGMHQNSGPVSPLDHEVASEKLGNSTILQQETGYFGVDQGARGLAPAATWQSSYEEKTGWRRHLDVPWFWPIASWVIGFLFFLWMIIILSIYDGKEYQEWPLGINLTTAVQTLVTLSELFVAITIGAALGQTRWLRLHKKTQMNEFCLIDGGIHEPLGSLELLLRRRGGTMAMIGAALTVLMLANGTFVQQSVQTPTHFPAKENPATIPVARVFDDTENLPAYALTGNKTQWGIDQLVLSGLYSGVFSPVQSSFNVTPYCETNNCTWPSYHTLAVCNECADLTSKLAEVKAADGPIDVHRRGVNYVLPNGFGLFAPQAEDSKAWGPVLNVSTTSIGWSNKHSYVPDSIAFLHSRPELNFASVIAVGQLPENSADAPAKHIQLGNAVAFECVMYFCVHEVTATSQNGSLVETKISTWDEGIAHKIRNHRFVKIPAGSSFTAEISRVAKIGLSGFFSEFFRGKAMLNTADTFDDNGYAIELSPSFSSNQMRIIFNAIANSTTGYADVMDNIAGSLSRSIRRLPNHDLVAGGAYAPTLYIQIDWPWLSLPLAVLGGGLVFFIIVVVVTKRRQQKMWLANIQPLLFHGPQQVPDRADFTASRPLLGTSQMRHAAHDMFMEIPPDGHGGHQVNYTLRESQPNGTPLMTS